MASERIKTQKNAPLEEPPSNGIKPKKRHPFRKIAFKIIYTHEKRRPPSRIAIKMDSNPKNYAFFDKYPIN